MSLAVFFTFKYLNCSVTAPWAIQELALSQETTFPPKQKQTQPKVKISFWKNARLKLHLPEISLITFPYGAKSVKSEVVSLNSAMQMKGGFPFERRTIAFYLSKILDFSTRHLYSPCAFFLLLNGW